MPLRSSSKIRSDGRHRTVARSKSDYGGGGGGGGYCTKENTVVFPALVHHHIDYNYRTQDMDHHHHNHQRDSLEEDCCTSSDGDTTMLHTTMNTTGCSSNGCSPTSSSDWYDRSTFGPGCSDPFGAGAAMRMNHTAPLEGYGSRERRYRTRSSSSRPYPGGAAAVPLFDGETSMGYGMDYGSRVGSQSFYDYRTTVPKTPSRSARVRDALLDLLLLGGRSRRRERKEKKRASSVAPSAAAAATAATSHRATSIGAQPLQHLQQMQQLDGGYERKREVTWLDERRRRRRRSSIERYMRTPSVDTALSPPYHTQRLPYHHLLPYPDYENNNDSRRWKSGEDMRRRWDGGGEEPRRKKKREVVRIWETPRPQCVRIGSMMEGDEERRTRRMERRKDAFVNSHEWTLSRQVSELHLGIIGASHSGKTALVHRYLTGAFQQEESPEGGRFKKEVFLEGQSHLLLIRDEGVAVPDAQFTLWTDAVLFVFAVDQWDTFEHLQRLYNLMCDYRSLNEMPVILVGTKDTVSEASPRVVTEEQGKRLAHKFGRCAYFETNAGYGTNVEKVFKDACLKMFHSRRLSLGGFRASTPTEKYNNDPRMSSLYGTSSARGASSASGYPSSSLGPVAPAHHRSVSAVPSGELQQQRGGAKQHGTHPYGTVSSTRTHSSAIPFSTAPSSSFASRASQLDPRGVSPSSSQKSIASVSNGAVYSRSTAALYDMNGGGGIGSSLYMPSGGLSSVTSMGGVGGAGGAGMMMDPAAGAAGAASSSVSTSHLPTPSSTPTTQRKNRRISNIFQRPSKGEHHHAHGSSGHHTDEKMMRDVGQGRAIPIMQGQLYKRSGGKSALNRGEWKKKFVTLTNDGKLTYHQSLKEYMDNGSGKEVFLGLATVRLPGRQRMRNSQAASAVLEGVESSELQRTPREASGEGTSGGGSDDGAPSSTSSIRISSSIPITPQTVANSKKRRGHTKKTGGGKGNDEDEECFEIVTCDQKRWEFCAASVEEREEWVKAIEGQIDAALQKQTSAPTSQSRVLGARTEVNAILSVAGNEGCADCLATRPEWASLNLGTLVCMECSGIHRNLGSHISKVRSLKFDEWPVEYLSVMRAIGNSMANRLWEARMAADEKPRAEASPEEREAFIRAKYVDKKYLAPLNDTTTPVVKQLIDAVLTGDVSALCALLTRATVAEINDTVSPTDRRTLLHLACSSGRVVVVQLLLWNNAEVRVLDEEGRSALWHARNGDANECAAVLIAAGLAPDYGIDRSTVERDSRESNSKNAAATAAAAAIPAEPQMVLGSMSSRDYTDSTRRLTSVGNA